MIFLEKKLNNIFIYIYIYIHQMSHVFYKILHFCGWLQDLNYMHIEKNLSSKYLKVFTELIKHNHTYIQGVEAKYGIIFKAFFFSLISSVFEKFPK